MARSTRNSRRRRLSSSDDEFDGITVVSEGEYQASNTRRPRSSMISDVDFVSPSPPTRRSPIRPPSSPTQSARPPKIFSSDEEDNSKGSRSDEKGKGREHSFIVPDDSASEYGDDDFDYDSIPFPAEATNIPDFSALPSTYRSVSPEFTILSDDEEQPTSIFAKRSPEFSDLKLLPELDERWRTFYLEHWRRGADNEAEEDDDGRFGVPAPVAAAKKAAGRGRWAPRGRGRPRGRAAFRRR